MPGGAFRYTTCSFGESALKPKIYEYSLPPKGKRGAPVMNLRNILRFSLERLVLRYSIKNLKVGDPEV